MLWAICSMMASTTTRMTPRTVSYRLTVEP